MSKVSEVDDSYSTEMQRPSKVVCRERKYLPFLSFSSSMFKGGDLPWPYRVRQLSDRTSVIIESDRFGALMWYYQVILVQW